MKNPIKVVTEEREDIENKIDSTVNTGESETNKDGKSMTIQESGKTDPNMVANKPSFTSSAEDEKAKNPGQFDGSIGI